MYLWAQIITVLAYQEPYSGMQLSCNSHAIPYIIVGDFWGRKLLRILQYCGYLWKFSQWNFGVWHPLAWQKWAIHKSFLSKNCIFHRLANVFSLKSLPLYDIYLVPLAMVPYTGKWLGQVSRSCWYTLHSSVSLEPTLDCSCRLWWILLLHFEIYQWTLCLQEWAPHSQL